jgi:hypothetical protein
VQNGESIRNGLELGAASPHLKEKELDR